ncbi:MAG: hypothetical protein ABR616_15725 [Dermatophilaceae bacterium]|nr:hypothetical protein [Intrasporangiaceae bacterium]
MEQKPTVGRIVHFYLNEDMAVSPALVINTHETANADLLAQHQPQAEAGSVVFDHESATMTDAGGWNVLWLESGDLDLKVFGLVKDYRAYSVPYSPDPAPGHWSWPPRV